MKKSLRKRLDLIYALVLMAGTGAVDIRGKIGGTVFSTGRGGAYIRNKVTGVDRKTPAQQVVKASLSFFAQAWRGLTQVQIAGWNTAAANGFTYTNIFGQTKHVSGINLYCGLNSNLRLAGQSAISDAPIAAPVANVFPLTVTMDVSASEVFVEGENVSGSTTVPAGTTWVYMSTGPVSAGVSFVNSQLRVFATAAAATDTATNNLFTDYTDKFGALVAGQKVFFQCFAVNNTTGQAGIPQKASTIVVA